MGHGVMFIWKGLKVAITDPQVRGLLRLTMTMVGIATVVYHYVEGWRWLDAVYFSVITLATVGYGDFSPQTDLGKLFTIFYVFSGIGLFVATVTAFANRIIKSASDGDGQ